MFAKQIFFFLCFKDKLFFLDKIYLCKIYQNYSYTNVIIQSVYSISEHLFL